MKKIKKEKNEKKKTMSFFKYLAIVLVIVTIITLGLFKFIDVLPGEYFLVLTILLGVITLFLVFLLTRKDVKKKIFGSFFALVYMVILIMAIIYEFNTLGFLKKLGFTNYKTENYKLIVLKDSEYEEIEDLENKVIGSLDLKTGGLEEAKKKLKKKIIVEFKSYDDITELKKEFLDSKVDAMIIEDSILMILEENDEDFKDKYRVIYDFAIDIKTEDIAKEVDITKDPFNIFVSGIDTYGAVSSVSRSDVNMVITVNPKTNKILITSIPRDYYVMLGSKGAKDKLTHAGVYGIDESVLSVEGLLDTKINYYIKVNFTSVINIVDALGGVNVHSDYSFTSKDGYYYNVGDNYVDGNKALSFVRERKSFAGGDRVRIENQAHMIEALVDKAVSPSIIGRYNNLLDALSNSFVTNMKMEAITSFIKMQIDKNPEWEIENYSLDGSDSFNYTYTYGSAMSYVMEPDMETVINAQNKIKEALAK